MDASRNHEFVRGGTRRVACRPRGAQVRGRTARVLVALLAVACIAILVAPSVVSVPKAALPDPKQATFYARGASSPGSLVLSTGQGTRGAVPIASQLGVLPPSLTVVFASEPYAAVHYLNLSQPLAATVSIRWEVADGQPYGVASDMWVQLEAFAGTARIGGAETAMGVSPTQTNIGTFSPTFYAETDRIPAGVKLELRVTLSSATTTTSAYVVAGDGAESTLTYDYLEYDPLSLPLYSRDGILQVFGDSGEDPPPEPSSSFEGAYGVGIAATALATVTGFGRRRRGGRILPAAMAALALALAGCANSPSDPQDDASPSSSSPQNTASLAPPEPLPGPCFEKVGIIRGYVRDRDQGGLAVPDAKVFLASTKTSTRTDSNGYYELVNVTPFPDYELVADAGRPFQPHAVNIGVDECTRQWANFSLTRQAGSEQGGGMVPHRHGTWLTNPLKIYDQSVALGWVPCGSGAKMGCSQLESDWLSLPREPPTFVEPGAARLVFTITGGDGYPDVQVLVQPAKGHPQVVLVPRPASESFSFAFFPILADSGHDPVSGWTFKVRVPAHGVAESLGVAVSETPSLGFRILAFKGVEILEPPHDDPWVKDTLPFIRSGPTSSCPLFVGGGAKTDDVVAPSEWNANRLRKLVTPGTKTIPGNLSTSSTTSLSYALYYRVLPDGPWTKPDTYVPTSKNAEFSIPVNEQWDGFYSDPNKVSRWEFGYRPASPVVPGAPATYVAGQNQLCLFADLQKDPGYVPPV